MSRHNRNDQDSPVLPRAKAGDVRHIDGYPAADVNRSDAISD